jgi:hypothetical protein
LPRHEEDKESRGLVRGGLPGHSGGRAEAERRARVVVSEEFLASPQSIEWIRQAVGTAHMGGGETVGGDDGFESDGNLSRRVVWWALGRWSPGRARLVFWPGPWAIGVALVRWSGGPH